MRILVIGAGIGGLCLAQGLARAGIDVRVYEREPGVHTGNHGLRIGLGTLGLAALRECLPERVYGPLAASAGRLSGERPVFDRHLELIGLLSPAYDGLAADRHVLRHLLRSGLAGRIAFGKDLVEYAETADGTVRAVFADGSTDTGDLLVGADGIDSPVRRQLLPSAEIVTLDRHGLLGRTPLTERFAGLAGGSGTLVCGQDLRMLIGAAESPRLPRRPDAGPDVTAGCLRWTLYLPWHVGRPPTGRTATRDLLLALVGDWHADLVELVKRSETVREVRLTATHAKPVPHWGTRRVTLLGDAIHAMPPSGGLSANTTLRDAALLCRRLATVHRGEAELLPAVEDYEREMLDYGFAAVADSLHATPAFAPTGP